MNRRSTRVAGNPVLIGAATVLVVIVAVFLAYNANNGPAVRADLPASRSSCRTRPNLVTGNEVRIGGDRVGIIDDDRAGGARGRHASSRELHVKLETDVKPLPARLDGASCARARRSASSTSRSRAGTSREGFAEGGTMPLEKRDAEPVEFDEFFNMFDEPTRAANQAQPARVRRRARRPRHEHQRGDRRARPAARERDPGRCATSPTRRRGLGALLPRAGADGRRRRARRRAAGQLFRNLAITFDAFARDRAPVPAGHDQRRPGGARHGDPLVPDPAAVARQQRPASSATCSRAPRALRTRRAGAGRGVRRRHAAGAARAALNDELALTAQIAAGLRAGPAGAARHPRPAPDRRGR